MLGAGFALILLGYAVGAVTMRARARRAIGYLARGCVSREIIRRAADTLRALPIAPGDLPRL